MYRRVRQGIWGHDLKLTVTNESNQAHCLFCHGNQLCDQVIIAEFGNGPMALPIISTLRCRRWSPV